MNLRRPATTVLQRSAIGGAVVLCAAVPAFAASSPQQAVHARLTPAAPAKHGSGTFAATGGGAQSAIVRWQLAVSNLSGPVRRATLHTAGSPRIVFTLCQPCGARSHGQLALIGSMWSRIVASGGTVVVATRAHPSGELRGTLKRS
jgi:hypothetical protein